MFVSNERGSDIDALRQLIERGQMSPVIDRTYPLTEVRDAIQRLDRGRSEARSRSRFDLEPKAPGQARGPSTLLRIGDQRFLSRLQIRRT
jgi:Zinc-binding dehydrogenase